MIVFFYIQDGFSYIFGCYSKGKGKLFFLVKRQGYNIIYMFMYVFIKLKFVINLKIIYWKFLENGKINSKFYFFYL